MQTVKKALFLSHGMSLLSAFIIMLSWLTHLSLLLSLNLATTPPLMLLGAILIQAFLNTGLFITAHDAIHGLVHPFSQRVNTFLGTVCAIAYAGLSYRLLAHNHKMHHQFPASVADPDFHCHDNDPGQSTNLVSWYCYFMCRYLSWQQLIFIAIVALIGIGFGLPVVNVVFLWGIPLLLSSFQLFYFGTYQPHRSSILDVDRVCSVNQSQYRPWLLSFICCYHFGYHQEHHENPNIPWWQLPEKYIAYRSESDNTPVK